MTAFQPASDRYQNDDRPGSLTCQWCSTRLPDGATICPTCGSPGVADPTLIAPGSEILEPDVEVEPVKEKEELDEWWLDDEQPSPVMRPAGSGELFEDRLFKTIGILAGAGAVCWFIGWLVGPTFLALVMESITGTPVEDHDDLRPMGSIVGLLIGLFFGASIGWVAQAER